MEDYAKLLIFINTIESSCLIKMEFRLLHYPKYFQNKPALL